MDESRTAPFARPTLATIVVNYDSWSDVDRLVQRFAASEPVRRGRIELIVVDNASAGAIPDSLRSSLPAGIRLLSRPDNGGFAAGVNTGWRHAEANDWILLLNPDVELPDHFLERILERAEAHHRADPQTAVVGFALCNGDGSPQPSVGRFPHLGRSLWQLVRPRASRKYLRLDAPTPRVVPWVTGACMLIRREALERIGGLDPDFFLYYEEVAFCRAAWDHGYRVRFDPQIQVTHRNPLQNRRLTATMRVIVRHALLLYYRKCLPRWQSRAMSWIVGFESRLGSWIAGLRRRRDERASHRIVARMSRAFGRDDVARIPVGTAVRALADSVISPAPPTNPDPTPVFRTEMTR